VTHAYYTHTTSATSATPTQSRTTHHAHERAPVRAQVLCLDRPGRGAGSIVCMVQGWLWYDAGYVWLHVCCMLHMSMATCVLYAAYVDGYVVSVGGSMADRTKVG
jgi:hypothetical protein